MMDEISALENAEQKGIEQGIEQGIRRGKEEGAREEKIEIAKKLLDVLDSETIAAKTGLTIDEIERLK